MGAGLPHVGPWDYIQHVPMFWYGPGHIKAQGEIGGNVTLADIAPTQAKILDFNGFTAPDGTAMTSAIQPGQTPPKLVVVLVWDSAGINVLQKHEQQWPYLRSLIPKGTWYKDAYVGSSPTSTAQDHATIGTGAFPIHHGIVAHHFQLGGQDTTPYQIGPNFFVDPTFADIYDQAEGNKPIAGMVATADIHLGMLGHGSFWNGGDRDIAMTRSPAQTGGTSTAEGDVWNLPKVDAPYYSLPSFLTGEENIPQSVLDSVDRADGKLDGMWRSNDIAQLGDGFDTPARTVFEERIVEDTIKNEGFGADDTPDLLYLNFKEIDYVGHVWSMDSPEMTDAVKYQDEALKRFIPFLNQQVGNGNWAMVITADHAAMPNPHRLGRVRDLDRRRVPGDRDEVRHERRLGPDRRQRAARLDLPERGRGRGEQHHDRRHRPVHPDIDAGGNVGRRRHPEPRPGERRGLPGGVPVIAPAQPALLARGEDDAQHRLVRFTVRPCRSRILRWFPDRSRSHQAERSTTPDGYR